MTCISLAKASVRAHSRCHHMTRKWSTNPRSVHFGFIGFLDCDRHNNTYIHTIENVIIESIRWFINTFHFFFLKKHEKEYYSYSFLYCLHFKFESTGRTAENRGRYTADNVDTITSTRYTNILLKHIIKWLEKPFYVWETLKFPVEGVSVSNATEKLAEHGKVHNDVYM